MFMKNIRTCMLILAILTSSICLASPNCDVVLEKCAKTVEVQDVAIEKQKVLIKEQKTKIVLLEDRNKEVEEDLKDQRKISISSVVLTILLLLL